MRTLMLTRLAGMIVWLGACVLIVGSGRAREDTPADSSAAVERIERLLGLRSPYRIIKLDAYLDGGSFGGTIADANGKQVQFAWDGRERIGLLNGDRPYVDTDPRLAYLGADYPAKAGSRPLPVGSSEESALVDVLRIAASDLAGQDTIITGTPIWLPVGSPEEFALRLASLLSTQRAAREY